MDETQHGGQTTYFGSGETTLMVGLYIVELEGISGSITLDSPLMEAYSGATSSNENMSGDFPTLAPGMNVVSWSGGVAKVGIEPNWGYFGEAWGRSFMAQVEYLEQS